MLDIQNHNQQGQAEEGEPCPDTNLIRDNWSTGFRLKDDFGARHLRVRGHKKVYAHLMFGVLALCVDQIVRLLN